MEKGARVGVGGPPDRFGTQHLPRHPQEAGVDVGIFETRAGAGSRQPPVAGEQAVPDAIDERCIDWRARRAGSADAEAMLWFVQT